MDIAAIGEILIDLTQTGVNGQGVPVFAANPGGAPANVAVAASRLGASTAFIGKVGTDGFGAYLRQVLRDNQVDTSMLFTDDTHTTMAIVTVDGDGERDFRFVRGADRMLRDEETESVMNSLFLHFGSVSLTQEPARSATMAAVRRAKSQGALISYDPNYRESLWDSREEAIRRMREPLGLVDVLKISEEELPMLCGSQDPEEGSRVLEEMGISLVMITLGGEGAFCRWKGRTFRVKGVETKVADTNGAGDTFLGAMLSQLSRRRPFAGLELGELETMVEFANRAASITCSRSGAIPAMPWLREMGG